MRFTRNLPRKKHISQPCIGIIDGMFHDSFACLPADPGCILTAKWASIVNAIIISSSVGYGFSILTLVINALMEDTPPEVWQKNEGGTTWNVVRGLQVFFFLVKENQLRGVFSFKHRGWLYRIKLYSDVGLELDMNYLRSYTCILYVVGTRGR